MTITSIKLQRIRGKGRLKAICSIVLDDNLVLNEIRLIENISGDLHCHYPAAADSLPSKTRYYYNPINRMTQQIIEDTLIKEYEKGCD